MSNNSVIPFVRYLDHLQGYYYTIIPIFHPTMTQILFHMNSQNYATTRETCEWKNCHVAVQGN